METTPNTKPAEITISVDTFSDLNNSSSESWQALNDELGNLDREAVDYDAEYYRIDAIKERAADKVAAVFASWAKSIGRCYDIDVTVMLRCEHLQSSNVLSADGDTWERAIWQAAHDSIPEYVIANMIEEVKDEAARVGA